MWGKRVCSDGWGMTSGFVVATAIGLLAATAGFATTFVNRPIGEVVKGATTIVRGRAGDVTSDWDKGGRGSLYTYTRFFISETLKGDLRGANEVLLRQPGGARDGIEMNVPGTAHFTKDEEVVVLLGSYNAEDGSYDVPGFATGKYFVEKGENGEPLLVNSMGGGAMYDPAKGLDTLSYNSKIPLEVFRRLAKGEDIPEGAHRQYEPSAVPPSIKAIEPHGSHGPRALPKESATPPVDPKAEPARNVAADVPVESAKPISVGWWFFAALLCASAIGYGVVRVNGGE